MRLGGRRKWLFAGVALASISLAAPFAKPRLNKLLYMYRVFYLPLGAEIQEGATVDSIIPYSPQEKVGTQTIFAPDRWFAFDTEWKKLRPQWRKKSLFETTEVGLGQKKRITPHLISHRISLARTALDTISVDDRIRLTSELSKKSGDVRASFLQIRFARSFLSPEDENRFNLIVIAPSWDVSSKEYISLIESYYKRFPSSDLTIHAVTVDDPKKEFFDSRLNNELFPNRKNYSHENTPRFLAVEVKNGELGFWEEADALQQYYERFLLSHRGFLDDSLGAPPVARTNKDAPVAK